MTKGSGESASGSKILVFIPTYGDLDQLEGLTAQIQRLGARYDVLVIDDGSRRAVTRKDVLNAKLVRLSDNMGLGVATHVAFDYVAERAYQFVIRIDGDGQHSPTAIPLIVAKLEAGSDFVIGARRREPFRLELRWILAQVTKSYIAGVVRLASRKKTVQDVTSGCQGFTHRAAQVINSHELERYPEPQIVLLAARHGLKMSSIQIDHLPRASGASTISFSRGLQIVYRFSILVLRELLQGGQAA